jgi:hypothetical protein
MNLIQRVKNILFTPKEEWKVIATEEPNTGSLLMTYALPLALIPAVAQFIGFGVFGFGLSRWVGISGFGWGISSGVITLISALISVLIAAYIIDALAPSFKSEKNFGRSFQLVVYSCTPIWVAGVLYLIPFLGILAALIGLYGIYLIYLGLGDIKKTPEENKVGYLVVSAIVSIVAMWFIAFILGLVSKAVFFGSMAAVTRFH